MYNEDGSLTNTALLRDKGFSENQHVRRKDGVVGTVKSLSAEKVILQTDKGEVQASAESFCAWKLVTMKAPAEEVEHWFEPSQTTEWQLGLLKAQMLIQLDVHNEAMSGEVRIFNKPKDVKAGREFEVGVLNLPFTTNKVDITKKTTASMGSALKVCQVTVGAARCNIYWFDMWMHNYQSICIYIYDHK